MPRRRTGRRHQTGEAGGLLRSGRGSLVGPATGLAVFTPPLAVRVEVRQPAEASRLERGRASSATGWPSSEWRRLPRNRFMPSALGWTLGMDLMRTNGTSSSRTWTKVEDGPSKPNTVSSHRPEMVRDDSLRLVSFR